MDQSSRLQIVRINHFTKHFCAEEMRWYILKLQQYLEVCYCSNVSPDQERFSTQNPHPSSQRMLSTAHILDLILRRDEKLVRSHGTCLHELLTRGPRCSSLEKRTSDPSCTRRDRVSQYTDCTSSKVVLESVPWEPPQEPSVVIFHCFIRSPLVLRQSGRIMAALGFVLLSVHT